MIIAKDIVKYYMRGSEKIQALGGVSIHIKKGDFSIITGPSGSGKSTFLNTLSLLDIPDGGVLSYDGQVVEQNDDKLRQAIRSKKIGFIFQSFNLIPVMTALENVVMPVRAVSKITKEDIERGKYLLNAVGLANRMGNRPNQLSGGQQQRIAIARALMIEPEVVFADEPTANLDSKTAESIIALLLEINKENGVSFIFSTHDDRLMKYARTTYYLRDGVIC